MSHSRRWSLFLYLTLLLAIPQLDAYAQFSYQIAIHSPQDGEAVQGVVPVIGFAAIDGFRSYTLEFSPEGEDEATWFQFASSDTPVEDAFLGDWDTAALTDGEYRLRLNVFRDSGPPVEVVVRGVRVRNYSPIETNTPSPVETTQPTATSAPSTALPTVAPSPFASNPAEISIRSLQNAAIGGLCLALAFITSMGILSIQLPMRRRRRKR